MGWAATLVAKAGSSLGACVLLAGCAGVEVHNEDDLELGREHGRDLVGDVEVGLFTWEEANQACNTTADAMRLGGDVSDSFISSWQLGCHEALNDAEEAARELRE